MPNPGKFIVAAVVRRLASGVTTAATFLLCLCLVTLAAAETVQKGIPFASIDGIELKLDLYRPDGPPAGLIVWVRSLSPDARKAYLGKLREFVTGDPMLCPLCHGCFVQVLAVERDAVLDKAYVIELVTVPPSGQRGVAVRGKQIGATRDWIHEHAKAVH